LQALCSSFKPYIHRSSIEALNNYEKYHSSLIDYLKKNAGVSRKISP